MVTWVVASQHATGLRVELPTPLHLFLCRDSGCNAAGISRALRKVACIHHIYSCVSIPLLLDACLIYDRAIHLPLGSDVDIQDRCSRKRQRP